jgi:hypothetical protein
MQHTLCPLKAQANVNSDPKPFKLFKFQTDYPKFMKLFSTVWSQEIQVQPISKTQILEG